MRDHKLREEFKKEQNKINMLENNIDRLEHQLKIINGLLLNHCDHCGETKPKSEVEYVKTKKRKNTELTSGMPFNIDFTHLRICKDCKKEYKKWKKKKSI